MKSNHTLKKMFNSVTLIEFYISLSTDKFPCVKKFAGKMFSIFGSIYIFVSKFFLAWKSTQIKIDPLWQTKLKAVMRSSKNKLTPDFKRIVKKKVWAFTFVSLNYLCWLMSNWHINKINETFLCTIIVLVLFIIVTQFTLHIKWNIMLINEYVALSKWLFSQKLPTPNLQYKTLLFKLHI